MTTLQLLFQNGSSSVRVVIPEKKYTISEKNPSYLFTLSRSLTKCNSVPPGQLA